MSSHTWQAEMEAGISSVFWSACNAIDVALGFGPPQEVVALLEFDIDDSETFRSVGGLVSISGFVSHQSELAALQRDWRRFVLRDGVTSVHTTDLLASEEPFKGWTHAEQFALLEQCAKIINKAILAAVHVSVEVAPFKALPESVHRKTGSARSLCFGWCLKMLVEQLQSQGYDYPVALVCDDSQSAPTFYKLLKKQKELRPEWRKRIGGIMFVEDELYCPVQAADIFAYLYTKSVTPGYDGRFDGLIDTMLSGHHIGQERFTAKKLQDLAAWVAADANVIAPNGIAPNGESLS